jgi:hypothetical protein
MRQKKKVIKRKNRLQDELGSVAKEVPLHSRLIDASFGTGVDVDVERRGAHNS